MNKQLDNLIQKIRKEELDVNNQELFFYTVIKGLLLNLKNDILIRNISVPHYILNSGSMQMYLEVKGQDESKSPMETINEDYIYSQIPRCIVSPKGINLLPDQLTNPYTRGEFEYEYKNNIYNLSAEFRRIPLNINVNLTYYTDSFRDMMELVQQIISKLIFVRTYDITYMGKKIQCSYKLPDSFDSEHLMEIDGTTSDNRLHNMSIDLEIESYFPTFSPRTVVDSSNYIIDVKSSNKIKFN